MGFILWQFSNEYQVVFIIYFLQIVFKVNVYYFVYKKEKEDCIVMEVCFLEMEGWVYVIVIMFSQDLFSEFVINIVKELLLQSS